jgi:hypothetical protein
MPQIVETVASAGHRWKVEIVRRSDGLLMALLFKWVEEVVPEQGKVAESWVPHGKASSFFDDLPAARKAAQELLAANEREA